MSNPQGAGEGIRRLMEELAIIMASKDRIAEKERRMLHLGITFVGGDSGVLCWRSGTQGVKPGHQVCWPKSGRTDVPNACLERVLATGRSIAPPDASGRAWADETPNGLGRIVVLVTTTHRPEDREIA